MHRFMEIPAAEYPCPNCNAPVPREARAGARTTCPHCGDGLVVGECGRFPVDRPGPAMVRHFLSRLDGFGLQGRECPVCEKDVSCPDWMHCLVTCPHCHARLRLNFDVAYDPSGDDVESHETREYWLAPAGDPPGRGGL